MTKIAVLGSINTDYVFEANNLPKAGETVFGKNVKINFGGKGANEAVCASRLGADVCLFGAVGDDAFSEKNIANLKKEKVNTEFIKHCKNVFGGSAGIFVGDNTNSIVVVSGANAEVDLKYFEKIKNNLKSFDVVGTQLEIKKEVVEKLLDFAEKNKIKVVFNPSPMTKLDEKLLKKCSFVVVNEIEVQSLPNYKSVEQILKHYEGRLIVTLGADGACFFEDGKVQHSAAVNVKVVDTTGAGDTFLASFMVAIAEGKTVKQAVEFANICASLKCTKLGAQTAMPTRKEVDKFKK